MKHILIIILILTAPTLQALTITEVELNPEGTDKAQEWIELYSESTIDLSDYTIQNNDNQSITINQTFKNYIIYTFPKQWLDNTDEKISIYKNEKLISETNILEDSKNNDLTWQICNQKWQLSESTKESENACTSQTETQDEQNEETQTTTPQSDNDDNDEDEEENKNDNSKTQNKQTTFDKVTQPASKTSLQAPIDLNPKHIKTEENSEKTEKNSNQTTILSLTGLLVFVSGLLLFQSKNKTKLI